MYGETPCMFGILYRRVIKPILFRFPADAVHVWFLKLGNVLGRSSFARWLTKHLLSFDHPALHQQVAGITFTNPVGLAAGFDYDADLIGIAPSVGFGFNTVGTLTASAYGGNPKPMLGRLPKSRSLLVNKGFKNRGIVPVLEKAHAQKKTIPLGLSIGATNKKYQTLDELIDDIATSFAHANAHTDIDYFELNISCPNLINIESLPEKPESPGGFEKLLQKLEKLTITRPVFVKMHNEKTVEQTLALVAVAVPHSFITGFIFANLMKDRTNPAFDPTEIQTAGKGNFSGAPTSKNSNKLISEVYKQYRDRFTIIGCGGIFTGADAYEKIRGGATLVQMITGMVYMGPQQIGVINRELVSLLQKDGYTNIAQAVGAG